jgi:Phage tail sheath protein subtilisin-like domain/Phage tail sheath C-terminal domain
MARPNVTFRINDESLVVPVTEDFSSTIGAVYNTTNALKVLGTTAEKTSGYMFVPNASDWYSRLTNYVINIAGGPETIAGITAYSAGSCAASYLNGQYTGNGISAGFSGEWWPVNNFLQYGAGCYVGFGSATPANEFTQLGFDVIFQGGVTFGNSNYGSAVTTIVDARSSTDQPVIGVVYALSTDTAIDTIITGVTLASGTSNYNYVRVYGEKLHLDTTGLYTIETPLAADVAGCIARTDRDYYPWFSPAGSRRGRILNVLRLKRSLTTTEQDNLYENEINPVVTFPGDGTLLYGDKTGETSTSTLSRINVSRLLMYIKKSLAPVARSILFEQNDAITRSRFKIAAEGFLDRIVGQRGISEYKVICDTTNNTPEIIEANYFVADILIKPITSINYVRITLTNKDLSSTL